MRDVRVDGDGELRCWNCGNKGFKSKRTLRSKMLVGVGALLTKKKLKCETCGEYNDTGNAKPYDGPASRKWRKAWEKQESAKSASQRAAEERAAQLAAAAIVAQAMQAQAAGLVEDDDDDDDDVIPPPPQPEPEPVAITQPAAWLVDPTGRHEHRYWNGDEWTWHVSDAGVQGSDSML